MLNSYGPMYVYECDDLEGACSIINHGVVFDELPLYCALAEQPVVPFSIYVSLQIFV